MRTKTMLSFTEAVKKTFRDYAVFSGRSRRSEYWWFVLFNLCVMGMLNLLLKVISTTTGVYWIVNLIFLYALAVLVPYMATTVRRLHDTGHSEGWLIGLLLPVPFLCMLWPSFARCHSTRLTSFGFLVCGLWYLVFRVILLVFCLSDSCLYTNKYGPSPKYVD